MGIPGLSERCAQHEVEAAKEPITSIADAIAAPEPLGSLNLVLGGAMRVGVCGLLVRDRRVLLGHRSTLKSYYPDVWGFIGGHVESDERPEDAMIREVLEEVGCIPTAYYFLETVQEPDPSTYGPGIFHIFVVTEWIGPEPQIRNEEHDDLAWFSLEAARNLNLADRSYVGLLARVDHLH